MKLYVVTVSPIGAEGEELLGVWSSMEEAVSRLDEYADEELIEDVPLEKMHSRQMLRIRVYADDTIGYIHVTLLNEFVWDIFEEVE